MLCRKQFFEYMAVFSSILLWFAIKSSIHYTTFYSKIFSMGTKKQHRYIQCFILASLTLRSFLENVWNFHCLRRKCPVWNFRCIRRKCPVWRSFKFKLNCHPNDGWDVALQCALFDALVCSFVVSWNLTSSLFFLCFCDFRSLA